MSQNDLTKMYRDIEKALKQDAFYDEMRRLNFNAIGYDEAFPDDHYFLSKDCSFIVFFSAVNAVFYVYTKTERRSIL